MVTSVALWDVCVHMHRCVHTSVRLCPSASPAQGLVLSCVPFPRKNAFPAPEMETKPSAVLGMQLS